MNDGKGEGEGWGERGSRKPTNKMHIPSCTYKFADEFLIDEQFFMFLTNERLTSTNFYVKCPYLIVAGDVFQLMRFLHALR